MGKIAARGDVEPLLAHFLNILKKIDNRNNKSEKEEQIKREMSEE